MTLLNILKNQCPHCHEGHIFESNNLFSFKSVKMNAECSVCHLDFTKEPGFYWGAMYASYGLALLEGFISYFVNSFIGIPISDTLNLWIIVAIMLIFSPFNFRMARVIWLYILPGIDRHNRLHAQYTH